MIYDVSSGDVTKHRKHNKHKVILHSATMNDILLELLFPLTYVFQIEVDIVQNMVSMIRLIFIVFIAVIIIRIY